MVRGTGIDFDPELASRRPGDPARTVADGSLAARDLGWAMTNSLDEMVSSAWAAWQSAQAAA
jgi:UDP-glucose 4-epimerase